MAVYTYVVSTEHNIYPNLTVYDRLADGVPSGWRVNANEGYVYYNANDSYTDIDPDTGEEIPVTYYYTQTLLPRTYNWNNFDLVAVPRSSVDENYIFGGGNEPEHEIM